MTDFGRRPAVAVANALPKTGQETSYWDGDDGYYEAGWEGDRFTDNGDGTITDNATGLMWPDDANGAGGNNGNTANWNTALDYAEALTLATHENWRLPNALELASLFDYSQLPLLVYAIVANAQNKNLWTSTTGGFGTTEAWYWYKDMWIWWVNGKGFSNHFVCCRDA